MFTNKKGSPKEAFLYLIEKELVDDHFLSDRASTV